MYDSCRTSRKRTRIWQKKKHGNVFFFIFWNQRKDTPPQVHHNSEQLIASTSGNLFISLVTFSPYKPSRENRKVRPGFSLSGNVFMLFYCARKRYVGCCAFFRLQGYSKSMYRINPVESGASVSLQKLTRKSFKLYSSFNKWQWP